MCVNPHGQRLGCCSSPSSLTDYKLSFQCFSLILETIKTKIKTPSNIKIGGVYLLYISYVKIILKVEKINI